MQIMWISKNAEKCTYTPPLGQKKQQVFVSPQKIFWKQCHNSLFCIFLPLGMATRHALKNLEIFRNFQEIRRGPWTPAAGFRPMAKPMAKSMAKPTAKPTAKPMAKSTANATANSEGFDETKF